MAAPAVTRLRGADMMRPPSLSSSLIASTKKSGPVDSPTTYRLPGVEKVLNSQSMMQRSSSGTGLAGRLPPAAVASSMVRRNSTGYLLGDKDGPLSPFGDEPSRRKSIGDSCVHAFLQQQQQEYGKESESALPIRRQSRSKTCFSNLASEPASPLSPLSPLSPGTPSKLRAEVERSRSDSFAQAFNKLSVGRSESSPKNAPLPSCVPEDLTLWSRQSTTEPEEQGEGDGGEEPDSNVSTGTEWLKLADKIGEPAQNFSEKELECMEKAFGRFADEDSEEVGKDELVTLLRYLGYFGVAEDRVDFVMSKISDFSTLSYQEFLAFINTFQACGQLWLQKAFADFTVKKKSPKGQLDFYDLAGLLRSIGVVGPRHVVQSALMSAGLDGKLSLQWEDVEKFTAAYRTTGHFTPKECERAQKAYNQAHEEAEVRGLDSKSSPIMTAVLKFFGHFAMEPAKRLFERLLQDDGELEKSRPVEFQEFMVWLRLLRDTLYEDYWRLFLRVSKRGVIGETDLQGLLVELGYSLSIQAIAEFLQEAKLSVPLDFDGFVSFVNTCNQRDGFRRIERIELKEVFKQFDYKGDGEIQGLGVVDMIRYLGYSVTTLKAHQMIRKVDFNDNGTMDCSEFMRLMRLQTEEDMMRIRAAFQSACSWKKVGETKCREILLNDLVKLRNAITSVGLEEPSEDALNEILMTFDWPNSLDLDAFTEIVHAYRKIAVKLHRQRASFDGEELRVIKACFQRHTRSKAKVDLEKSFVSLQKVDLMNLLSDLGAPKVNSLSMLLGDARKSARESGVITTNLGEGESRITLWDALHLLHGMVRSCEDLFFKRESDAVEETKFTVLEMNELRSLFEKYHEDATLAARSAAGLTRRGSAACLTLASTTSTSVNAQRRKSAPCAVSGAVGDDYEEAFSLDVFKRKFTPVHIKIEGMFEMLKDLGAKVPLQVVDKAQLFQQLEAIGGENCLKDAGFAGFQFPDFLRLMRLAPKILRRKGQ